MKKILLLLTVLLLFGCMTEQNPHKYSGCVVTDKAVVGGYQIQVKLTPGCKKKLDRGCDYLWFYTVKWEYDKLNIGDTIKGN